MNFVNVDFHLFVDLFFNVARSTRIKEEKEEEGRITRCVPWDVHYHYDLRQLRRRYFTFKKTKTKQNKQYNHT